MKRLLIVPLLPVPASSHKAMEPPVAVVAPAEIASMPASADSAASAASTP